MSDPRRDQAHSDRDGRPDPARADRERGRDPARTGHAGRRDDAGSARGRARDDIRAGHAGRSDDGEPGADPGSEHDRGRNPADSSHAGRSADGEREAGSERARAIRRDIRERMARAIYHREARRDPGDGRPRATWEELNQGRRATRLNYADELLSVLFGALGLGWDEVDGIRRCAEIARGAADAEAVDRAEQAGDAAAEGVAEAAAEGGAEASAEGGAEASAEGGAEAAAPETDAPEYRWSTLDADAAERAAEVMAALLPRRAES